MEATSVPTASPIKKTPRSLEDSIATCKILRTCSVSEHAAEYVKDFHEAFGHPVEQQLTIPTRKTRLLRVRLIAEELKEYAIASGVPFDYTVAERPDQVGDNVDVVEAADALADLDYVTAGSWLVWGFPYLAVNVHVHDSNMSKLDAEGKAVQDEHGKVIKGPNFWEPDIAAVLGLKDVDQKQIVWREYS